MEVDCHSCVEGINPFSGNPCTVCGGDSKIDLLDSEFDQTSHRSAMRLKGFVYSTLLENCLSDGVFWSYKVLECLDTTEHAALTDAQKNGILHILACGKVDLNEGKAGRVRLWNWFDAESTTVANLTALLE